jgi:DNA adenine methylase
MPEQNQPFLPWVGGKRNVADQIIPHIPTGLDTYYEPFLGGGALFFRVRDKFKNHALSDINLRLTTTYNSVKKNPDAVLQKLKEHAEKDSKDYYKQLQLCPDANDPVQLAANFIYLVSQSFYRMYRVAKDNTFRLSYRTNRKLPVETLKYNMTRCSVQLQGVPVTAGDFSFMEPGKNDFVYMDPPYHKAGEDMYTPLPFDEKEQIRLKNFADELNKNGTRFAVSNSDTPFIRELYKDYQQNEISVKYQIGKHPVKTELLITNG